ncbi:MAG TPA: hypothetical protein VFW19_09610 [Allosphingosinicella sp.]|nr:hypothetical protein [Allosphingosinicella sp.]
MGLDRPKMSPDEGHPADFKPRRAPRRCVEGSAELSHACRYKVEVKVHDVSTAGFMAECTDRIRIGSHVSLDVPGIGPVRAQVRWQLGGRMGGMFLDPISLSRCEWTAEPAEAAGETVEA